MSTIESSGSSTKQRDSARRERAIVVLGVTTLGAAIVLCLGMLARIFWTPFVSVEPSEPVMTMTQCNTFADDAVRLACYDLAATQLAEDSHTRFIIDPLNRRRRP
jgi:hypothetical protein